MPKPLLLKMAFNAGYEAAADAATCGELLVRRAMQNYPPAWLVSSIISRTNTYVTSKTC
jgi:hypothetical protein